MDKVGASKTDLKEFTDLHEILLHNTNESSWLLIDNKVFDVTEFKHPGGKSILRQNTGQDATVQFEDIGHTDKAFEDMEDLIIGYYKPEDDDDGGDLKGHSQGDSSIMFYLFVAIILGFGYYL